MGRPPKFSRAQIQQVALQLVDEQGLDHLTMRNVAEALETGPMTLYGHVRNRADLEVLVVDAIFEEMELPRPADEWNRSIEEISVVAWSGIRKHRHATNLVLARRGQSRAALAMGEAIASNLKRAGLNGMELVVAFRAILATIVGGVEGDPVNVDAHGTQERFGPGFRDLIDENAPEYPGLVAMLPYAAEASPEEILRRSVRLVVAGIDK